MLSDLLNLLRGRDGGPVGFLMLPALMGDPFARDTLVWRLKDLGLHARPRAGYALRSWGEAVKHSSNDGVEAPEDDTESTPAPNLKGGQLLFSLDLKDTVLVE